MQNDTLTKLLRVRLHDVAAVEILAPGDTTDTGSVRPKVRVRNNGTQKETFRARFRIPDLGYNNLAQEFVFAETTIDVGFVTRRCTIPGFHAMSCTLELDSDQVHTNDIITGGFFVGIVEGEPAALQHLNLQTINRGVLFLDGRPSSSPSTSWLLNTAGLRVLALRPGANDVRALAPGVYFVREAQAQAQAQTIRKVVVTR